MKPTQAQAILAHLQTGAKLTPLEALERFGTLRLAARIWDLRQAGHVINERDVTLPNGKTVAQYWMTVTPPKPVQGALW